MSNKKILFRALVSWLIMNILGGLIALFASTILVNMGIAYYLSMLSVPLAIGGAFSWFGTKWTLEYVREFWNKKQ